MAADVTLASGTASYLSGSIKWSGLASGVDFGTVVDQLVELERLTITNLTTWRADWSAKVDSITTLNTRMSDLKTASKDMDTFSEFYSRVSTSTDSSVVSVTNSSTASAGSHSVTVGENIPGRMISTSYEDEVGVGGTVGEKFIITVGDKTLELTAVDGAAGIGEFDINGDIDALAQAIKDADNAAAEQILGEVYAAQDKDRDGTIYKRLVINAKNALGGSANAVSISDPTNLSLDENSLDQAYVKGEWGGTSTVSSGGTYNGNTNKTFTFRVTNSATLTSDPETSGAVIVQWADNEGHGGKLTVDQANKAFEVFQGVEITFGEGLALQENAFTIDAYNPTLQAAQDVGLAAAEQRVHSGFSDMITKLHAGPGSAEFVYRYEGVETTVEIPEGAKLQDLVNAINMDPLNRGVKASIVNDGQSTATSYHLVLTGQKPGAQYSVDIVSETMDNFEAADSDFSTPQKAANALFKVDGYPSEPGYYLQRSSNTVADIITGVTLNLKGSGTAVVTVSDDVDAIEEKINNFISYVNYLQNYINVETRYDSETKEKGVMLGNYTYDIVKSDVNRLMAESLVRQAGDEYSYAYTHLSQIGITSDPDNEGMWVIDDDLLTQALNEDLEGVARLFVQDPERGSNGIANKMRVKMEKFTDSVNGIGNVLITNYNGIMEQIDEKIAREEKRVAAVQTRLEEKFARLETALSTLEGQSSYLESQLSNIVSVK
ncbi:MAG: flagellar filament capping protein FliD [Pseudomonadota bacterium]